MSHPYRKITTIIFAALFCISTIPQSTAQSQTGSVDHFAFGVEYDWTNMNQDFESMTGLPLDDILGDIMQSADDAGIELILLEELTGTSSMVIDQYQDGTQMLTYADGTESIEVTKHVTELTVRHGSIADLAVITEWSDARAGWDLTISMGSEGVFNVDAYYVEYRDAEGLIYGHDIDMSLDTEQSIYFNLQGIVEADDSEHVLPLNIQMDMGVDYSVNDAQSSVRYLEPSTLYQELTMLEGGDELEWGLGENDDYVYWNTFDGDEYVCSWTYGDSGNYYYYSGEGWLCNEIIEVNWTTMDQSETVCEWNYDYYLFECHDGSYDSDQGHDDHDDHHDDHGDDEDSDIHWVEYGHCDWEGTGESDTKWWCSEDTDVTDGYDDWWYYCEDHTDSYGYWYCTDDYGQSEEHSESADNDRYTQDNDHDDQGSGEVNPDCDDSYWLYNYGTHVAYSQQDVIDGNAEDWFLLNEEDHPDYNHPAYYNIANHEVLDCSENSHTGDWYLVEPPEDYDHEYFMWCEEYSDTQIYACTNSFADYAQYDYSWSQILNSTHYVDDTSPPNFFYYRSWNYPYCEYYEDENEYACTSYFGYDEDYQNSLTWTHYQDGTSPLGGEVWDQVESHTGTFSTTTGFEFDLSGLPAEEMGLPSGKWDVSASDSAFDSGSFDGDMDCEIEIELYSGMQTILTDGDEIEVMQAHTTPLPFGMECHLMHLFEHTFEGTEGATTLDDMISDSTEEIEETMDGSDDSYADSDNMEMWLNSRGGEVEVEIQAFNLEPNEEYEISISLKDSDGITQNSDSFVVYSSYYGNAYEWTYLDTDEWGDHCVTAQLRLARSGGSVPLDTVESCVEVPQEVEPSELIETIVDGFSESTLENVMENFADNLEYRLDKYETDFPYDDGDMFVLWDPANNMVVGFQLVVREESSQMWHTLVGPESDSYSEAPRGISMTYFSGMQAIAQEADIEDDTSLTDLVDLTEHNDDIITDAIQESIADYGPEAGGPGSVSGDEDADDSGLLPFISPAFTIAIIAIAGLVASMRNRKD